MKSAKTILSILKEVEMLGRDEDSLNYFEWKIDSFHDEQRKLDNELYSEMPELLQVGNDARVIELHFMLDYFEDKEEYEKCARIKKLIDNLIVTTE